MKGTESGCINHPGIEATHRCKQCNKPVCDACVVPGPTGRFCSTACKEKHEAFTRQAQRMEGRARSGLFVKLRKLAGALLLVLAVCLALGVIGTVFTVPVLSDIVYQVRGIIGI